MLKHSGAVALVTLASFRGREFLDALRGLCPELDGSARGALSAARLPALRSVVALDGTGSAGVCSLPEFWAQGASVDAATLSAAQRAVAASDICYILYFAVFAISGLPQAHPLAAIHAHASRLALPGKSGVL